MKSGAGAAASFPHGGSGGSNGPASSVDNHIDDHEMHNHSDRTASYTSVNMPNPSASSAQPHAAISAPSAAPLDPATSAMVLSRLQDLSLPGNVPPYDSSQYTSALGYQNASALTPSAGDNGQSSSSANPNHQIDFGALLASLTASGTMSHFDSQSQTPAYVSASQLHPSSGVVPSSSMTLINEDADAGPSTSTSSKKKAGSGSRRVKSAASRAASPDESGFPSSSVKRVPPFLNKLRNMIDDVTTNELICWQPEGKTFLVPNNVRFAKEVLPRFFKHNNFSSFVRQLNMYGFHKVPSLQQGSLKHEQEMEVWEFENENFVKDKPELMMNVQRKPGHKSEGAGGGGGERDEGGSIDKDEELDGTKIAIDGQIREGLTPVSGALTRFGDPSNVQHKMTEFEQVVTAIQLEQNKLKNELGHFKVNYDALWREMAESRRRSEQQSETINRMLRFLAGVFAGQDVLSGLNNNSNEPGSPSKGRSRGGHHSGSVGGPGRGLYRNHSNHPLMIQGSSDRPSGSNETLDPRHSDLDESGDNSERFHELFTRISETNSDENTPRGSLSPPESTTPKFTQLRSPTPGGEGSGADRWKSAPSSSASGKSTRPSLADTPRRPSTPGTNRNGKLAPQQLLSALQQMFASAGNGDGGGGTGVPGSPFGSGRPSTPGLSGVGGGATFGSAPGTPGTPKMDHNLIASLQNVIAMIQSQQGLGGNGEANGFNSNANEGSLGLYNNNVDTNDQQDDSNRFIYPYTGGPTGFTPPSSSLSPSHQHTASPGFPLSGSESQLTPVNADSNNPFAQQLQTTEADSDSIQRAINALVETFRASNSGLAAGPGPESGSDVGLARSVNNTTGPFWPSEPAPGNWNQYAGASTTSLGSQNRRSGTSKNSSSINRDLGDNSGISEHDVDVDALLSQFIDSTAATAATSDVVGNGSSGNDISASGFEGDAGEGPATSDPPSASASPVVTRLKRKSLDAEGDVDMLSIQDGQGEKVGEGKSAGDGDGGGEGQKRKKVKDDTPAGPGTAFGVKATAAPSRGGRGTGGGGGQMMGRSEKRFGQASVEDG